MPRLHPSVEPVTRHRRSRLASILFYMKTAEEWVKSKSTIKGVLGNLTTDVVKKIQLDALKEGMLRAAKLAGARPNTLTMWEVEKFIVSAAEQLKTP